MCSLSASQCSAPVCSGGHDPGKHFLSPATSLETWFDSLLSANDRLAAAACGVVCAPATLFGPRRELYRHYGELYSGKPICQLEAIAGILAMPVLPECGLFTRHVNSCWKGRNRLVAHQTCVQSICSIAPALVQGKERKRRLRTASSGSSSRRAARA